MSISEMSIPEQILYGGFFIAFLGETGCGKTTSMTWFAYWINERLKEEKLTHIKLYSNYELNNISEMGLEWNYTYLSHPEELVEILKDHNAIGFCFIDELWKWILDSYGASKNAKRQYDDICSDARKSGLGFFASSQRFMRIDPNFRANVHYVVFPQLFFNLRNRPYRIAVTIINNQTEEIEENFNINPNFVFKMFKTRQKIERYDNILTVDLEDLSNEFNEWNTIYKKDQKGNKIPIAKQQITQSVINLFLQTKRLFKRMTKEERNIFRALVQRSNL